MHRPTRTRDFLCCRLPIRRLNARAPPVHAGGRAQRRPGSPSAPESALTIPGWRGVGVFREIAILCAALRPAWITRNPTALTSELTLIDVRRVTWVIHAPTHPHTPTVDCRV